MIFVLVYEFKMFIPAYILLVLHIPYFGWADLWTDLFDDERHGGPHNMAIGCKNVLHRAATC